MTEMGWGTVMHGFVEYPVTLAKDAPKMLLRSANEHEAKHMGLQQSPSINTRSNVN
jgi:hypothetical protein